MTTRTIGPDSARPGDPLYFRFKRFERAMALVQVQYLADSGKSEREIAAVTGWSIVDIRRAIGARS